MAAMRGVNSLALKVTHLARPVKLFKKKISPRIALDTTNSLWHTPSLTLSKHALRSAVRPAGGRGCAAGPSGEETMLMRRLGGAAALLALGLCVSARAADDAAPSGGGSIWSHFFNPFAD